MPNDCWVYREEAILLPSKSTFGLKLEFGSHPPQVGELWVYSGRLCRVTGVTPAHVSLMALYDNEGFATHAVVPLILLERDGHRADPLEILAEGPL